ncbi:hypothetical protein SAMN02910339_00475 [Lachnospiraceae bacterium YSD2013]|nr:hypothetical protein SAMN02910339_00475 [Lachnospiraceae bacterium YSD2013]
MYVIISHDVDHLLGKEHWIKDLYYPKLWIRETIKLLRRRISLGEWLGRIGSCFAKERNGVESLQKFDAINNIPSTFFFGMRNGLALSYSYETCKRYIAKLKNEGFSVGVHGICFDEICGIGEEKERFCKLMGYGPDGIRMHYVRFNDETFKLLAHAGYAYDSTDFDKEKGYMVKSPYFIDGMCEFPVTIMDSYLPENLEMAKRETIKIISEAKCNKLEFITVLFHDIYFRKEYKAYRNWYLWFIEYICNSNEDSFISFEEAVRMLKSHD